LGILDVHFAISEVVQRATWTSIKKDAYLVVSCFNTPLKTSTPMFAVFSISIINFVTWFKERMFEKGKNGVI
jgi:hypothetical protein